MNDIYMNPYASMDAAYQLRVDSYAIEEERERQEMARQAEEIREELYSGKRHFSEVLCEMSLEDYREMAVWMREAFKGEKVDSEALQKIAARAVETFIERVL